MYTTEARNTSQNGSRAARRALYFTPCSGREEVQYSLQVTWVFRETLNRQLKENINILKFTLSILLNIIVFKSSL